MPNPEVVHHHHHHHRAVSQLGQIAQPGRAFGVASSSPTLAPVAAGAPGAAVAAGTQDATAVWCTAVFEQAPFSMVVCDPHGLVVALNPAAERLLGCRAADVVARRTLASLHHADDLAVLTDMQHQLCLAMLAAPGQVGALAPWPAAPGQGIERPLRYLRPDGSCVGASVTLSALRAPDGSLAGYLSLAYDNTERQQMAQRLSHLAFHDSLTGLANRATLEQRLQLAIAHARQSGRPLALLFIDLDRFKPVNDRHGHDVGDQVLCEVARRLQQSLRDSDLVARLGGDEFVVLLSSLAQPAHAAVVAEKLRAALAPPMQLGPHRLQVGASIGMACFPEGGQDAASLLRTADAAMYQAKNAQLAWTNINPG